MTSGIIEILIEDTNVQNMAGFNKAGDKYKVYPVVCEPTEVQPYYTVFQSDFDPVAGKACYGELDFPTFTVVANAKNFRKAELMAEAAILALDGRDATTNNGYKFTGIQLINHREGFDEKAQLHVSILLFKAACYRNAELGHAFDESFNINEEFA